MGGCVGTRRGNNGHGSRRASAFSDSTSSGLHGGTSTKNRPLRHEKIRWKSDIPLTDGQLKSKRDEFWDTAPAFEGKVEIWNALKAAAEAGEAKACTDHMTRAGSVFLFFLSVGFAEKYKDISFFIVLQVKCFYQKGR